jgi:hypothetical protein
MSKNIWLQALVACFLVACGRGSDNQQTTMPESTALEDYEQEEIQRVRGTDENAPDFTQPGTPETYPSGSPMQDDSSTTPSDITTPDHTDTSVSDPLPNTGTSTEPETTTPMPDTTSPE